MSPGTAVITLDGICQAQAAKTKECKTEITRAEFERLMDTLSLQRTGQAWQSVPPQARWQLAMQYSRLLVAGNEAEKQGLQNTPEGQSLIRFAQLEALTTELTRELQKKAKPTPEEMRKYYDGNPERFSELALQRIQIPILSKAEGKPDIEGLRKVAEDLRQRASAGGDFKALQAEAFKTIGQQDPPEVKLALQPELLLPPAHSVVRQLKPGEVSQVIQDAGGFYIYRLDATHLIPFEQEQVEIRDLLAGQTAQRELQKLIGSATPTLNPKYFEQAPQSSQANMPSTTR